MSSGRSKISRYLAYLQKNKVISYMRTIFLVNVGGNKTKKLRGGAIVWQNRSRSSILLTIIARSTYWNPVLNFWATAP